MSASRGPRSCARSPSPRTAGSMASGNRQLPSRFIDELPAGHVEVLTAARACTAAASGRRRSGFGSIWRNGWRRRMSTTRPAGSGCRSARRPARCGQPREARHVVIDADGGVALCAGRPGVPPEVRLWDDRGDRGRQAGHRLRQGRDRRRSSRASSAAPRQADDVPF